MITSKEVTAIRKAGKLDEAYAVSLELIAAPEADDWDRAAHGWCLIDMVKRCAVEGDQEELAKWLSRLDAFEAPLDNDVLARGREKALAMARPDRREALKAQALSKQERHEEAAEIYARLHGQRTLLAEDYKSWGWDLYHSAKGELRKPDSSEIDPAVVQRVKRSLNTYLAQVSAQREPPEARWSRRTFQAGASVNLHSLMLTLALRLAKSKHLKMMPFLRFWNPDRFTDEDFERQTGSDGRTYPSLAERALQSAAADAIEHDRPDDYRYILPHVEAALKRFPDNIWLKLHLVKLLRGLRRYSEALALAIQFAREKASEYWVWDLLAELSPNEPELQLSCCAKALICSQDDDFVAKVRLKLATLIANSHPAEARFEVERVLAHYARAGYRIPRDASAMSGSAWYLCSSPRTTGESFYARFTEQAEALLFSHLPWADASLGHFYKVEGKDGQKPRRRRSIYVREESTTLEFSLPDTHPGVRELAVGAPLLVQYETSVVEPWRATIHRIRLRPNGSDMDAVPERIGVIDHVNQEKAVLHVIVARGVDGVCPISIYPGDAKVGSAVAVRIARRRGRTGERTHIVSITPADQSPPPEVCRSFNQVVEITDRGFGFTRDDVFLPPHLVAAAGVASGDIVEGTAILSYDKRGGKWGMKAVAIRSVTKECNSVLHAAAGARWIDLSQATD